jgi:hypothetical protein
MELLIFFLEQSCLVGSYKIDFHIISIYSSTIAQPASSWIDDYFDWINSAGNPPCCRLYDNGTFCPATCKYTKIGYMIEKNAPLISDFEILSVGLACLTKSVGLACLTNLPSSIGVFNFIL